MHTIYHNIIYGAAMTATECKSNFKLMTDTPYLTMDKSITKTPLPYCILDDLQLLRTKGPHANFVASQWETVEDLYFIGKNWNMNCYILW